VAANPVDSEEYRMGWRPSAGEDDWRRPKTD
jgi:hypothetical protein